MVRGAAGWGPRSLAALVFGIAALFKDSLFRITGSSDTTKRLAFEVDTQSAGFTTTIDVGAQTGSYSATLPVMHSSSIFAMSASALTSGRVPYATTNGLLIDHAGLTYLITGGGQISLGDATGQALFSMNSAAATSCQWRILQGGFRRWTMQSTSAFDYSLTAHDSAGSAIDVAMTMPNAAAGAMQLGAGRGITLSGAIAQTGAVGMSTGTAAISLNGATTVIAGKQFNAADTTDATTTATGAIITAGGVGIAKALWVGGLSNIAGVATLANTTDSTSATTGGGVVTGGLGVSKTLISAKGQGWGVTSTATHNGATTLVQGSTIIQTFTGTTAGEIPTMPAANLWGAGIAVMYVINNQSNQTITPTRAGSDTFQGGGTTDPVLAGATQWYASNGVSVWLKI